MQTLTLYEINQVSGAGFFSYLGDGIMMGTTGLLCAAAATKYLSDAAMPYVGALPVEAYAVAGFVAGATAIYGLTHNTLSNSSSGYFF